MIGVSWFHVLIIANLLVLAFGLAITGLSFLAYRSSGGDTALRDSTLGFLLITIGGVLAPVYEVGIMGDYLITGNELLQLQILEGSVIAVGLALLVISVYRRSKPSKHLHAEPTPDREDQPRYVGSTDQRDLRRPIVDGSGSHRDR